MKRISLVGFVLCLSAVMFAQVGRDMPVWVTNLPQANPANHFYYRVTIGEGQTYDKAYANAFAKAALEANWKLGVRVNIADDLSTLEKNITSAVNMKEQTLSIPINKVCEWWEEFYPNTSKKHIRLYILWQIADDGRVYPKFEEFNNCQ